MERGVGEGWRPPESSGVGGNSQTARGHRNGFWPDNAQVTHHHPGLLKTVISNFLAFLSPTHIFSYLPSYSFRFPIFPLFLMGDISLICTPESSLGHISYKMNLQSSYFPPSLPFS